MAFERLILATASPRRIELFHQLGLDFEVQASQGEEPPPEPGEAPDHYAQRLATFKAKEVQVTLDVEDAWFIGADTVVVLDEHILGKPSSEANAKEMLHQLSGKQHEVVTAFTLWHKGKDVLYEKAIHTQVWFWDLTPQQIEHYVQSGEPMDKAGAYGIQAKGAVFVRSIEGCYFNVVGLPISHVVKSLEQLGAGTLS